MWSDPVADMLTRIRNGVRVRAKRVTMPASKLKQGIAQVLKNEGYVNDFDVVEDGKQGILRVDLKYGDRGEQVIEKIERTSKVGRRVYRKADALPQPLNGLGIAVVTTSSGVLSDRQCREKGIGGEVLCTVY
jgi:small subunit ribosomal protein S8